MILSIRQYIRCSHSNAAINRHIAVFVADLHQKFLIAEIGRFLEHKFVCSEEMVLDRQAYVADLRAFVSDVESVLAVPCLRENPYVSELQNIILYHCFFPLVRVGYSERSDPRMVTDRL